MHSVKIRNGVQ